MLTQKPHRDQSYSVKCPFTLTFVNFAQGVSELISTSNFQSNPQRSMFTHCNLYNILLCIAKGEGIKPLSIPKGNPRVPLNLVLFYCAQPLQITMSLISIYLIHYIRQTVISLTGSTSSFRSKELLRRQPQSQHQILPSRICLPSLQKASPSFMHNPFIYMLFYCT